MTAEDGNAAYMTGGAGEPSRQLSPTLPVLDSAHSRAPRTREMQDVRKRIPRSFADILPRELRLFFTRNNATWAHESSLSACGGLRSRTKAARKPRGRRPAAPGAPSLALQIPTPCAETSENLSVIRRYVLNVCLEPVKPLQRPGRGPGPAAWLPAWFRRRPAWAPDEPGWPSAVPGRQKPRLAAGLRPAKPSCLGVANA